MRGLFVVAVIAPNNQRFGHDEHVGADLLLHPTRSASSPVETCSTSPPPNRAGSTPASLLRKAHRSWVARNGVGRGEQLAAVPAHRHGQVARRLREQPVWIDELERGPAGARPDGGLSVFTACALPRTSTATAV